MPIPAMMIFGEIPTVIMEIFNIIIMTILRIRRFLGSENVNIGKCRIMGGNNVLFR